MTDHGSTELAEVRRPMTARRDETGVLSPETKSQDLTPQT